MIQNGSLLIVDDNEEILLSLRIFLEKYFEEVYTLNSPELILQFIKTKEVDSILLDMNFTASIQSGNEGFYWMNEIKKVNPQISIVFITAYPGIDIAIKAIKSGAFDFIEKPWSKEKLLSVLINAVKLKQSKSEISLLKDKGEHLNSLPTILPLQSKSDQMRKVNQTIEKVSKTDASVLILGENGTGKEVQAREIHSRSSRAQESFIKVDVGSLAESLFESEMFGYEKGAFTDAKHARAGKIELADKGTLFLDEIGNLSLNLQSKLLSVIQEQRVIRLGSNKERLIDFRLICATNQPLIEMIQKGSFREDLFYRINTVQVELPALRERKEDILNFANYFLKKYTNRYNKVLRLHSDLSDFIVKFEWPGNIRQLDHAIENAVIMCDNEILMLEDFSLYNSQTKDSNTLRKLNFYTQEKELVINALKESKGNLSKAANILGVARTTLYRKIKKYDL